MKINLAPQRREDSLSVVRNGALLTINGEEFDFSRMVDGDRLPFTAVNCEFVCGDVICTREELELTLLLPLPANYSPEQAFPEPLLNIPDGPVALPQPLSTLEPVVVEDDT